MTQKSEIGNLGENIACEYLKDKGYWIIERNFRKPWGELDIIAKSKDGTLIFVEVKTMRQLSNPAIAGLDPEDQLTAVKLKKLRRTASLYAGHNQELIKDKRGWRIDLVAINLNNLTDLEKDFDIKHYENL